MSNVKNKKPNYKKGFETEDRDIQKGSRRSSRKGGRTAKKVEATSSAVGRDFISSTGKPTNDPKWYINNPVLSRDVGNLFFSRPTGEKFAPVAVTPSATTRLDTLDPGILAFPSVITWGGTPAAFSGGAGSQSINLTAQKLYQFVVHANSRNTTYDKKDLIMSIMAIDSVYALITEAIRAYRLIAMYDPTNKYVSKLLTALNWDVNDLASNVAQFRYYINYAISRVNKFFMPALFDIVKAHTACYENIYLDRPSTKAQMYVKFSAGLWLYDDVNGTLEYTREFAHASGTSIVWSNAHTVNDFRLAIDEMITRIENSQYMGVMQGDMLKAFGFENMSNYAYVGIDMPITPVYDEEFLYKLHNGDIAESTASFFQYAFNGTSNAAGMIYRDTNNVDGNIIALSGPTMLNYAQFAMHRRSNGMLIDLPAGIPATPDNVILMTLYKIHEQTSTPDEWHHGDGTTVTVYYGRMNPEILFGGTLYVDPDNLANVYSGINTWSYGLNIMSLLSRFAVTPMITEKDLTATSNHPFFWHTDNVANLSASLLDRITDVVFWSLWSNSTIASQDIVSRETRV